jgi:hypothetical protein
MLYRFDSIDVSDICFSSARRFVYLLAGDMKSRLSHLIFYVFYDKLCFICFSAFAFTLILIAASFIKKE